MTPRWPHAGLVAALLLAGCVPAEPTADIVPGTAEGVLTLRVLDGGDVVPARLLLRDAEGTEFVPPGALGLVGDCVDRSAPETIGDVVASSTAEFNDARTASRQFYLAGALRSALPAGRYAATGFKGPEYRRVRQEFQVSEGGRTSVDMLIERWVDMASEGWFSADTHLHVARPDGARDQDLLAWLAAEDLHVGNLLQWGNLAGFFNAAQADFTPVSNSSAARPAILLPGQENPRTEFMGHAMGLSPRHAVNLPKDYFNYSRFATELRRAGGLVGIGHAGEWGGGAAVALLSTWDLLDFVEVFTFRTPDYQYWYETLDAGLRVAATAGSDFPCGGRGVPPGSPRMYARIDGALSATSWADAVRRGRTFVTNGPMLELTVNGRGMGEELSVPAQGSVEVRGRLRFDPEQESIRALDLVRNGEVIEVFSTTTAPGEIAFTTSVRIHEASWLAVRAFGTKSNTAPQWRNTFAHSGAIFVRPEGSPPATATARAALVRGAWRERLAALRARLSDRSQHEILAGLGKDRAVADQFAGPALSLLREIQRALDHGALRP